MTWPVRHTMMLDGAAAGDDLGVAFIAGHERFGLAVFGGHGSHGLFSGLADVVLMGFLGRFGGRGAGAKYEGIGVVAPVEPYTVFGLFQS